MLPRTLISFSILEKLVSQTQSLTVDTVKKTRKLNTAQARKVPRMKDNMEDEDDEDEVDEDDEDGCKSTELIIPQSMRHMSVYDKQYSCIFCEKLMKTKLSRHLLTVHKTEQQILELCQKTTKGSKERKDAFIKLEKLGAYKHNLKVIQNETGTLLVQKRPSVGKLVKGADYRACPECRGFYNKSSIRRHLKQCTTKFYTVKELKQFYTSMSYGHTDEKKFLAVLSSMAPDGISEIVKTDSLIRQHGKNIYEGFNYKKESDVSYRMRLLGRLCLEVRKLTGNEKMGMSEIIHPSQFDNVIKAVRLLCQIGPGDKQTTSVPSTALKIGHELKHCTHIMINMAVRTDNWEKERQGEQFKKLHMSEWCTSISKHSLKTLEHKKSNDPIPFTSDIQVSNFINHIDSVYSHAQCCLSIIKIGFL